MTITTTRNTRHLGLAVHGYCDPEMDRRAAEAGCSFSPRRGGPCVP
jgi:hypothetical protein